MFTKKRIIIAITIFVVLIFLFSTVSIRNTYFAGEHGECLSIAFFEKPKMWGVDRVVIEDNWGYYYGDCVEIAASELVNQIVKETTVASYATSEKAIYPEYRIHLYNGDKLIRSMKWDGADYVEVYEADELHWLFTPKGGVAEVGMVKLSTNLKLELKALVNAT